MALTSNDYGMHYANYKSVSYGTGTGSLSALVKTGVGKLASITVTTASTTPLLAVYDGTTYGGSVILDTFTPVAGTMYHFAAPIIFENGLYLHSSTGSVIATVAYF